MTHWDPSLFSSSLQSRRVLLQDPRHCLGDMDYWLSSDKILLGSKDQSGIIKVTTRGMVGKAIDCSNKNIKVNRGRRQDWKGGLTFKKCCDLNNAQYFYGSLHTYYCISCLYFQLVVPQFGNNHYIPTCVFIFVNLC